jgi:hypothetical protein
MKNSVYRIRTYAYIVARTALDLFRDVPAFTYFETPACRKNTFVISSIGCYSAKYSYLFALLCKLRAIYKTNVSQTEKQKTLSIIHICASGK